jgi:hypothetical protein
MGNRYMNDDWFNGYSKWGDGDESMKYIKKFLNDRYLKNEYYQSRPKKQTIEDRVVDIVKGGFEDKFGMTIQEFQEAYDKILDESPERLV